MATNRYMDNLNIVKETALKVEKKSLALVLPHLGSIPLQGRTKMKKPLKASLIVVNCKSLYKQDQIRSQLSF